MEAAVAADYSQKQHAMYYFTDDTLLEQRRQESPRTGVLGCPGSLGCWPLLSGYPVCLYY